MEIEITTYNVEEEIQRLMTTNPIVAKALNKVIAKTMARVGRATSKDIQSIILNDTRQASKAVKYVAYKRIFGGNVSILDRRKASRIRARLVRSRTLREGQRGGNRVPRSKRTEEMDTFFAQDRAFVLRWLDSGANRTDPGAQKRRGNRAPGNRGLLSPIGFFGKFAEENLEKMVDDIEELVLQELAKINKK